MCSWIGSVVFGIIIGLLCASIAIENVTGGSEQSSTLPISIDLNMGLFQSCLDVKVKTTFNSDNIASDRLFSMNPFSIDSSLSFFPNNNNPTDRSSSSSDSSSSSSSFVSESSSSSDSSIYHGCSSLPISSTDCDLCFTFTIPVLSKTISLCNPLYDDSSACTRFHTSRGLFLGAFVLSILSFLLIFGYSIADCCCSNTSTYYSVNRGTGGVYLGPSDRHNYDAPNLNQNQSNIRAYMVIQAGTGRARALSCALFSAFLSSILLSAGLVLQLFNLFSHYYYAAVFEKHHHHKLLIYHLILKRRTINYSTLVSCARFAYLFNLFIYLFI